MLVQRLTLAAMISASLMLGMAPAPMRAETPPTAAQLEAEGRSRFVNGETTTAIAPLEAALEQYQTAGDEAGVRRTAETLWYTYGALALEQELQGDSAAALTAHQRQRELADLMQDPELQAHSAINIGASHLWLEHWSEARHWLQQGTAQARDLPTDTPTVNGVTLLERGLRLQLVLESVLNNAPTVIALANELSTLSASPATDFQVMQALGSAYLAQGDADQALAMAQDLLTLAQSLSPYEEAAALALLGEVQLVRGETEAAIATLQRGLSLAEQVDPILYGQLQGILGKTYALVGDWDTALPLLTATVELERALGSEVGQALSLTNLGTVYLLTENWAAAEQTLTAALDHWAAARTQVADPLPAIAFFDTQLVTYRNLQQALVAQGQTAEALVVSEQGRAQVLTQQLLAQHQAVAVAQGPTLADLQAIARTQNVTLVEYSLIPENQEIFIPNRVNNRWLNTATQLYIWVIAPDGEVAFESVPMEEADRDLATTVSQTRQAIGARGRAGAVPVLREPQPVVDIDAQLQQLYRLLIDPIAPYLPENPEAPVVFIPQESLFLVPFAALKNDQGQYLIERHTLLTAPSIQSLRLLQDRAETRNVASLQGDNALIVGNPTLPTLPDFPLSPLPGTEQEAIAIATRLNTTPLLGADATETAVRDRLPGTPLIHLATHGLLDYGDPAAAIPGAIALAPDAHQDGLLTATELAEQALTADLVVLSACDTGQGSITGDGVVGLSRSLLAAGVPRVVVSLWAVPDMPTAALMTSFYEQLDAGQGTAQALRQAMLATMQDHPDPKDWAAFTLIGESE